MVGFDNEKDHRKINSILDNCWLTLAGVLVWTSCATRSSIAGRLYLLDPIPCLLANLNEAYLNLLAPSCRGALIWIAAVSVGLSLPPQHYVSR